MFTSTPTKEAQATISVEVMDSTGKLVMESIVETKAATILEFFAGLRGTLWVTFIYNPGCQLTASKDVNGLPPNPDPIPH